MMVLVAVRVSYAMRVPTLSKTCLYKRSGGRAKCIEPKLISHITYRSIPFVKRIPRGSKTQHLIHYEENPCLPARVLDLMSPPSCTTDPFSRVVILEADPPAILPTLLDFLSPSRFWPPPRVGCLPGSFIFFRWLPTVSPLAWHHLASLTPVVLIFGRPTCVAPVSTWHLVDTHL